MIKITLNQPSDFLKVKETLTRMGIANNKTRVLYQSCHILQKRGEYFIAHFKDLMRMDGKKVDIDDEDNLRTLSIAKMLESWNLLKIDQELDQEPVNNFRIISFKRKSEWELVPKYIIGQGAIAPFRVINFWIFEYNIILPSKESL